MCARPLLEVVNVPGYPLQLFVEPVGVAPEWPPLRMKAAGRVRRRLLPVASFCSSVVSSAVAGATMSPRAALSVAPASSSPRALATLAVTPFAASPSALTLPVHRRLPERHHVCGGMLLTCPNARVFVRVHGIYGCQDQYRVLVHSFGVLLLSGPVCAPPPVSYLRGISHPIPLFACISLFNSTGNLSSKTNWNPKCWMFFLLITWPAISEVKAFVPTSPFLVCE